MGSLPPPPLGTFKVLLVDDHDLVRVGLRTVLDEVGDMKITWLEADNLHDAMRMFGQAKGLGAVGYLPKAYSPSLTRSSIVGMLTEYSYAAAVTMPAGASAQRFPRAPSASSYDRVAELGPRHLEILELVLSGCSNQEISNSTKLSLGTVKNYVSTILLALDVKSRSHLISLFR